MTATKGSSSAEAVCPLAWAGIPDKMVDSVRGDSSGTREIGFAVAAYYNAGHVLFDDIAAGGGDRLAIIGPLGRTLCGRVVLGLGSKISAFSAAIAFLMFLDDTPG
jgi:hypothetical protein